MLKLSKSTGQRADWGFWQVRGGNKERVLMSTGLFSGVNTVVIVTHLSALKT
jgi:hypothetical protein